MSSYEPGDESTHDFLRLDPYDIERIMYICNRLNILAQPRLLRRLCPSKIQSRLYQKMYNHEYLGMCWKEDHDELMEMMQPPQGQEPNWIIVEALFFSHPLLYNDNQDKDLVSFKQTLKLINQKRPKTVICTGYKPEPNIMKLLSKINESINVVLNISLDYYTFWLRGSQFIVITSSALSIDKEKHWFYQEMELTHTSRHLVFVFIPEDVESLPKDILQKMSWGKVTAVIGSSKKAFIKKSYSYDILDMPEKKDDDDDDEEFEEKDLREHTMLILGMRNCVKKIILEEDNEWKLVDFE